ncbi:MAG TPA: hypothetical protein DEA08_22315 [Planctomycetes bacterium]|nr:hypothetical protein [Planctomycetota bacterium]
MLRSLALECAVYPLMIAASLGLTILLSCLLIPQEAYYISGPVLGSIAFVLTFVILSRKIGEKVRPILLQAQRQVQAGNVAQAIASFEEARAYNKWQLMLDSQINTQIGTLYFAAGEEQKAEEFLRKGVSRNMEGPLVLGTVLYRQGKVDEARQVLADGIKRDKKARLLHNLLAWILDKEGQRAEAIKVLEASLKPLKDDEDTVANLERLREDKRMNMKPFGQYWYMLKFETPAGAQVGQFRKGFRQPPKNKGKRPQGKKGKKRK